MTTISLTPNPSWPREDAATLTTVAQLLAHEDMETAFATLSPHTGPWFANARAVCCLRRGRTPQAIDLLRPLVFDSNGLAFRANIEPTFLVNYALALLLQGNEDSFLALLKSHATLTHPAMQRVQQVVRDWYAQLSLGQRLARWWGGGPPFVYLGPVGEL